MKRLLNLCTFIMSLSSRLGVIIIVLAYAAFCQCLRPSVCLTDCPSKTVSTPVNATTSTMLAGSFWTFAGVCVKVWIRCISNINFCHFLRNLNLVIFKLTSTKALDTGYLVNATPTILAWFVLGADVFCQGLQMNLRFGWNPQIVFVTFSTVWT